MIIGDHLRMVADYLDSNDEDFGDSIALTDPCRGINVSVRVVAQILLRV